MIFLRVAVIFHLLHFASLSSAQALLSYEQLLELPEAHQREYMQDLQKLVVELATQEVFHSHNQSRFEKYFAFFIGNALGSERLNKICELQSARHLSNTELFSKIAQTRNCTEVIEKGRKLQFVSSVPKRVEVLTAEFNSRVLSGVITAQTPYYDSARGDLLNLQSELLSRGSLSRVSTASVTPQVMPIVAPTSQASSAETAQCLYGGFLIPKNSQGKCLPFRQLPDSLAGAFFSKEEFACVSREQIICNPVIFGFENVCDGSPQSYCQKKPVCVWKSQDATKNCFEASSSKKSLSNIMAFIRSPEGSRAYQEFAKGLELLCRDENLKARKLREAVYADIRKTCEVSFQVLDHNLKNKYLPELVKSRTQIQPAKSSK